MRIRNSGYPRGPWSREMSAARIGSPCQAVESTVIEGLATSRGGPASRPFTAATQSSPSPAAGLPAPPGQMLSVRRPDRRELLIAIVRQPPRGLVRAFGGANIDIVLLPIRPGPDERDAAAVGRKRRLLLNAAVVA